MFAFAILNILNEMPIILFLYQPSFPVVDWEPLEPFDVTDRGHSADPEKRSLLSAATKVTQLTPVIGVEIEGIDLTQLSDTQKDEL